MQAYYFQFYFLLVTVIIFVKMVLPDPSYGQDRPEMLSGDDTVSRQA